MTMKLEPPHCPVCGELARGMLESAPGLALLALVDNGEAEYEGETKMYWDEQAPCRDRYGRVTLECPDGHQWPAQLIEDDVCSQQASNITHNSTSPGG